MKKVLVTGGSSGIGKAICELLIEKGYQVIGTSRSPQQVSDIGYPLIQLDVTNESSIKDAASVIQKDWGSIDVLINNAGIGFMGPLELAKPEHIRKAWETNVFGLMRTTQLMLPLLKLSNDSRIINIGSIGGKMGLPYRGWYSAAKGSLEILGESLSMELKPFNIQVCSLLPGDVSTDIANSRLETPLEELGPYKEDYTRMKEVLSEEMESAMVPEKIALAVLSLLKRKNMPLKKSVGSFLHKITPIIKNLTPQKWFQKLIIRHYR